MCDKTTSNFYLFLHYFTQSLLLVFYNFYESLLAGITTKFQPVCFFCGDTEVDSTSQTVQDLRKNYSIVRPICGNCISRGIQPKVRNALKLNKK